jgi:hypothetical protein
MTIQELDKDDIQLLNRFLKNQKAFIKFRKIMLEWRNKKYHVFLDKKPKQQILYDVLFDTFDWYQYNREYWNEIDKLWTSIITRIYPNKHNIVNRLKKGEKDLSEAEKEKYYNIYVKKI